MARSTLHRIGVGLGGAAVLSALVIGGASAASATDAASGTTTNSQQSTATPAAPTKASATALPTTSNSHTRAAKTSKSSNSTIYGVNLTVKNTTSDKVAVTFNYSGPSGGDAQWTWLSPNQTTSVYNATSSGPDIFNSYVYFPSTGKTLKFESKLAAWSADTTITFDGTEYELDRGQSKSDNKQGHAITVSRGSEDLVRPKTEWIDGMSTIAPDMVLNFTL